MEKCVDPAAPWVPCVVCDRPIKTCERKEPVGDDTCSDWTCPIHNNGCELDDGNWVCSPACYDLVIDNEFNEYSFED